MDARTDVEKGLPGRQVTGGPGRATQRTCRCATQRSRRRATWLADARIADAVELIAPAQAGDGPLQLSGPQLAARPPATRTDRKTCNADSDTLTGRAFGSADAPVSSEITRGELACMTAFEMRQPIARHLRRRDVVTRPLSQSAASGGSTAAPVNEPAIAHEAGNDPDRVDVFKKTPCAADLKPAGRDVAKDMFESSNIPLLMTTRLIMATCTAIARPWTGRTIADNLKSVKFKPRQDRVRPKDKPSTANPRGGRLGGQPLPEGAIVTVAGMSNLGFIGRARCFEPVGGRTLREAEATAIRDERTHGGPGIADTLYAELTDAELAGRRSVWLRRVTDTTSGRVWTYAQQAGSTTGGVTPPGGAYEKQCDANI